MRAWIVGNGPSLNETPLHLLENEVTFGVNLIDWWLWAGKGLPWQPNHFVWIEGKAPPDTVWKPSVRSHVSRRAQVYVSGHFARKVLPWNMGKIRHCHHYLDASPPKYGWHLPQVCSWGGSVLGAIQIAILRKFSPIFLVGCDLGSGHFYDNEATDRTKGLARAHEFVREQTSWPIYNAGRGGLLEVYPRVVMEDVLNGKANLVDWVGSESESDKSGPTD